MNKLKTYQIYKIIEKIERLVLCTCRTHVFRRSVADLIGKELGDIIDLSEYIYSMPPKSYRDKLDFIEDAHKKIKMFEADRLAIFAQNMSDISFHCVCSLVRTN